MNKKLRTVLRHAMEVQLRYKFYQDIQFPYLPSLGIRDVLQGFEQEESGFIGALHLWWENVDSTVEYDKPAKSLVPIRGLWRSRWLDSEGEAADVAIDIRDRMMYHDDRLVVAAISAGEKKLRSIADRATASMAIKKRKKRKKGKKVLLI